MALGGLSGVGLGYTEARRLGLAAEEFDENKAADTLAGNWVKSIIPGAQPFQPPPGPGGPMMGGPQMGGQPPMQPGQASVPMLPPGANPAQEAQASMQPGSPVQQRWPNVDMQGTMGPQPPAGSMDAAKAQLAAGLQNPPPGSIMNPNMPQQPQGQAVGASPIGAPQGAMAQADWGDSQDQIGQNTPPGPMSLAQAMQGIAQANPGAPPHLIFKALQRVATVLNPDARLQYQMMRDIIRDATTRRGQDIKADTSTRGQDIRAETAAKAEEGKTSRAQVRADQAWQRLDVQRQQLERQVKQGNDRTALARWRAIIDAQHKRALEIIQSNSIYSNLPAEERNKLLQQQNEEYQKAIEGMRDAVQNPPAQTPTGGGWSVTPVK